MFFAFYNNGNAPFNWAVDSLVNPNYDQFRPYYQTWAPGTDVIALAQIVTFFKWVGKGPEIPHFGIRSSYPNTEFQWVYGNVSINHYGFRRPVNINTSVYIPFAEYGQNYYWEDMKLYPDGYHPQIHVRDQIATLVFQMGCKMNKIFTDDG